MLHGYKEVTWQFEIAATCIFRMSHQPDQKVVMKLPNASTKQEFWACSGARLGVS
jgi:hypothetical protein